MKEIVLCFGGQQALPPIRRAMTLRRIALRAVPPQDYTQPLAALAGAKDCPRTPQLYDGPAWDEPMLLFCGFSAARLDLALNALRREGLSVPLKAILTASNRAWTPLALRDELAREHAALHESSPGSRSHTSGY